MTGPPAAAAASASGSGKAKAERPRGRDGARFWELLSYGWCSDLVHLANKGALAEHDAVYLMPKDENVKRSAAEFDECYQRLKAAQPPSDDQKEPGVLNTTFRALCVLHWKPMARGSLFTAIEVAIRLLGPVILRQFLRWLQSYARGEAPEQWRGWMLAVALGASGFVMAVMHHQMFWEGMHMGFLMRQQCIAAIHSKVMRLNSAAIGHVSSGHVVNLVSNDVRRFDDAMPFWMFLWAGPLELAMVFLMVSLELGVLPALAGVASTLLLIPVQAALVRPVGNIRQNTAARTDERVRLASEAIQGSLAMKMLSWERPIGRALCSIREREASWIHKMARIRAINNALYFAITPVVAFATFAVYRALNGALNIPSVFYALSLLLLPKLYMVLFFITAVQSFTELVVSLKRIDRFLNMEEPPAARRLPPPPPATNSDGKELVVGAAGAAARVALRGADYDWARPMGHATSDAHAAGHAGALSSAPGGGGGNGTQGKGGDGVGIVGAGKKASHDGRRSGSLELASGPTLKGIVLDLAPGELLGVTGEVGSGKSSLLSALLGELLPLPLGGGPGGGRNSVGAPGASSAEEANVRGVNVANVVAVRMHLAAPGTSPGGAPSAITQVVSPPGKAPAPAPAVAPAPLALPHVAGGEVDRESAPRIHSGPSVPGKPLASPQPLPHFDMERESAPRVYSGPSVPGVPLTSPNPAPGPDVDRESAPRLHSGPSVPGKPLASPPPLAPYLLQETDRESTPRSHSGPSVPGGAPLPSPELPSSLRLDPLGVHVQERDSVGAVLSVPLVMGAGASTSGPSVPGGSPPLPPPPQPVESERGSRDSVVPKGAQSGPLAPANPRHSLELHGHAAPHAGEDSGAKKAHNGPAGPGKPPLPPAPPAPAPPPSAPADEIGPPGARSGPSAPGRPLSPSAPHAHADRGADSGVGGYVLQEVRSGPSAPGRPPLPQSELPLEAGERESAPRVHSGPSAPGRPGATPHVMLEFAPESDSRPSASAPSGAEARDQSVDDGPGPILCGRVAYCGQIPWIVSGTVRDNIVFDSAWDEAWYKRVIQACALEQDFKDLPAGDMTELGERGINLSGGQKARVALARCCYSRADVQLLDDPLSAVDPRVGRLLFGEAILKLMEGSMRVLITHQRQVLPRCDRVMVLRGGRVVALGTWAEVSALGLPELNAGVHAGDGAVAALAEASVDELAAAGGAAPGQGQGQQGTEGEEGEGEVSAEGRDSGGTRREAGEEREGAPRMAIVAGSAQGGIEGVGAGMNHDAKRLPSDLAKARLPSSHTFAWFRGDGKATQGPAGGAGGQGDKRRARAGDGGKGDGSLPWEEGKGGEGEEEEEGEEAGEEEEEVEKEGPSRMVSTGRVFARGRSFGTGLLRLVSMKELRGKRKGMKAVSEEAGEGQDPAASKGQLVQAEGRQTGTTPFRVYMQYAQAIGVVISAIIWALLFAGQAAYLAADWWLALWSRVSPVDQLDDSWLWVYGLLTGLVIIISFIRAFIFFNYTVKAATTVHNQVVARVLKAPLSFFHTNPTGRILNRFSKDLSQVDDLLPVTLYDAFQTGFGVLSAFVLVAVAVPVILPVFVPLVAAFYWLRVRYVNTSREIKRWEAVTRSPVFASFSASLKGLPTIRAFSSQRRFHDAFLQQLQANGEWYYAFMATARWIGFRLDIISATTLLASALLAMAIRDTINASILALALTYILQLTGYLQWFVRQTAEVENHVTALERLVEYNALPQEPADVDQGGPAPPKGWPSSGRLQYDRVTAVYRPGLPPVLRDLSFELQGGSSCGLVGRTGSGKSSLMLTLFRLIDVTSGSIYLDGLDVASIGLDALRAQLAIIPQDPVLFSGTIRSNLDPWNRHADSALWEVLSAVKLNKAISSSGGLHTRMQEAGDNLSVGQRQLFCLARALLQDARVLALDEATANVDRGTDQLIQQALRDFAHADRSMGRVLLVIAHRLDTIIDMDHLLVLSAGELVEQGSPQELCERTGGLFAGMVAAVGALTQK